jgi:hypothetical protein
MKKHLKCSMEGRVCALRQVRVRIRVGGWRWGQIGVRLGVRLARGGFLPSWLLNCPKADTSMGV